MDSIQQLAGRFGALGNPHRLRIFLRLMSCCTGPEATDISEEQATAFVGELGRDLGIAPSTVSHHIKELRQSGLIHMERRGQNVACWVEPGTVRELAAFFQEALDQPQSCACGPVPEATESSSGDTK
ncbi:MAG: helix-turn-helix transcriptional regulator [Armatimonadetes bacterium]|nr:helix-turn-helix transcriptional regulator [Armatimonadota bacterium]